MRRIQYLIEKIFVFSKKLLNVASSKPRKAAVLYKDFSYSSQWESRDLVDKILSGEIKAEDDPLWKKSGAKTKKEYSLWSWNACGMACLNMILKNRYKKDYPLVELGKKCLKYGGYEKSISGHLEGLFYEPFLRFIKKDFDLNGKVIRQMIVGDIIKALENKSYVIASVNPNIRDPKLKPKSRGGHLVLVTGYDLDRKIFYLHNPSGFYNKSQEHFPISFKDFEKFFSNRGLIIFSQ